MIKRLPWAISLVPVACFSEPPAVMGDDTTTSSSTGGGATEASGGSTSPTTLDPDTTAADATASTGPPEPCMIDDECMDATQPFCSSQGACVDCMGAPDPHAACASLDAGMPVCVEGACVECSVSLSDACEGTTPLCDATTNSCIGCTTHAQCGAAACNLFTGACLPADAVVSVGVGQDFATLGAAVAAVMVGEQRTILVYDDIVYSEAVTVGVGRVVAFLASPGAEPEWQRTTGAAAPQLTVTNNATVMLEGIAMTVNASSAHPRINVTGGSVCVDRGRLVQGSGSAVLLNNAEMVLRNCFLSGGVNRVVLDSQGSMVDLVYSTLAASYGASTALTCDAASMVRARNSILVSLSDVPEVACALAAEHTASEMPLLGTGNMQVPAVQEGWFTSYADGDYHLTSAGGSAFANIALWNDGDPLIDIDYQARPGVDGSPDHAGADRP